jgi:hypothetical protein
MKYTIIVATKGRVKEAALEHKNAVEAYNKNPTEYSKNEMDREKTKTKNWTNLMMKLKS